MEISQDTELLSAVTTHSADSQTPLSTEQLLLLNNLMYMTAEEPLRSITTEVYQGKKICTLIESIDTKRFERKKNYGSYMTGADWQKILKAIRKDDRLMQMTLAQTGVDEGVGGGGGVSALFTDPDFGEAVVCYRGTAAGEWKDNFIGGGSTDVLDGVSTLQQKNALSWYQSLALDDYATVTVTGHSKGGNKAKYVTILDSSVDRCVAFDGQGFSDEFVEKYKRQIAGNQHKIRNCNVDGDYVNLLLNDVGTCEFYQGWDIGAGGFLENHCPNTLLKFLEDDSCKMYSGSREPAMEALDQFLNSYLRFLSPAQKKGTLLLFGTLAEAGFHGAAAEELTYIALRGKNPSLTAKLLAYIVEYGQANPDFSEKLQQFLSDSGMQQIAKGLRTADMLIGWDGFGGLLDGADWLGSRTSDETLELLSFYIEKKTGLEFSGEELRRMLTILHETNTELDRIPAKALTGNGADRSVADAGGTLMFLPDGVAEILSALGTYHRRMTDILGRLRRLAGQSGSALDQIKPQLQRTIRTIEQQCRKLQRLKANLQTANRIVTAAEQSNCAQFSAKL